MIGELPEGHSHANLPATAAGIPLTDSTPALFDSIDRYPIVDVDGSIGGIARDWIDGPAEGSRAGLIADSMAT